MTRQRKIIYKNVRTQAPYCNVCHDRLSGNGSTVRPYRCRCGEWKYSMPGSENDGYYIKHAAEEETQDNG